jgi:type I restriction enzyme, S subunit
MIPKDWKRGLMGEVIKLISGQHIEAQFYNEDKIGIPYLTGPSDFQDGKINITKYTEQPKVLCESGDILITVKGSGTGKSIIANQKCCIGRQLMAVRATKIDRTFAFYIIQSREAKYGDTASGLIPGIAREHILETSLLIPPLLEQCRIAEVLGVWDESIDLLERLIGRVRSRKQGLMQQLLTGKKRFKEFEGSEWKTVKLIEVAEVIVSPVDKVTVDGETSVLLCNYTHVYHNIRITKALNFMIATATEKEIAKFTLIKGDVIITKDSETPNDIAIPSYVSEDLGNVVCGYHLSILRPRKNQIDGEYLSYLLSTAEIRYYFFTLANGATRFGLSVGSIEKAQFNLPSIPEQEKIAAVLSAADDEISTLEKQLAAYKQQKLGLMQQLLTGKIRVG